MNIALLLESDGPGGAERMVLTLARGLRDRGHHVIPIGPSDGCGWLAEQFRRDGFHPEAFTISRPLDPGCVSGLIQTFRARRVEVAHSHEFGLAIYGAVAARICGTPHIITMHGSRYFGEKLRRRLALRLAIQLSRATVTVSADLAEELTDRLHLPLNRVVVVPNGQRLPGGDPSKFRHSEGLQQGTLIILAVGSLYHVKGHEFLLRAYRIAMDLDLSQQSRIVIAGREGPASDRIRRLVRELGLSEHVRLLGHRDDVPNLLAAADIFCHPSLDEGSPLSLIEAMSAGKAIVATAVGGVGLALRHGVEGFLVKPGEPEALAEAILSLANDPEARNTLGAAAAVRANEMFSPERMASTYERLYMSGRL